MRESYSNQKIPNLLGMLVRIYSANPLTSTLLYDSETGVQ